MEAFSCPNILHLVSLYPRPVLQPLWIPVGQPNRSETKCNQQQYLGSDSGVSLAKSQLVVQQEEEMLMPPIQLTSPKLNLSNK